MNLLGALARLALLAPLAIGASVGVVGCASDDGPPQRLPEDDVPEDRLASTLFTGTLRSDRTFRAFSTEGGGFGQAGHLMKYFIDVRSGGSDTYFVNSNYLVDGAVPPYATMHFDFAKHQLGIADDPAAFNAATYYGDDKQFIAGTIQTYTLGNDTEPTYAIQFYPDDVIHEEGILAAARILAPRITIPGRKLAMVATGPQQTFARVEGELRALGVEPMTIDAVLGSVTYLPLNAGEAWGFLRVFPPDQSALRPSDIPVFDELPLDLSVVAGTITRTYQDVTSHVNLKSKERGTPNMVLRDASRVHPQLAALADEPVHLVVGKTGFVLEPTSAEIVEQKLAERSARPWIALPQVAFPTLQSFDAMCPSLGPACLEDGGRFGGKATGLGFLTNADVLGRLGQPASESARFGYELAPWGFAIPVQRYRDFVAAHPALAARIDALVAAEKGNHLSASQRSSLASEVQSMFLAGHVPPAQLAEVTAQVSALSSRFPAMDELKFRSSATAEDIPNFDGAGLHDSFSVKLSAVDRADGGCTVVHDAGDPATKLKVAPRTPACAIKAVYASLWNPRAIDERSFARLDHATAGMGIAVVPAYDTDAPVAANGVLITRIINGADVLGYTLSLQLGNNLVTNPDPGTVAQMTLVTFSADPQRPDRFTTVRNATLAAGAEPTKQIILSETRMAQIVDLGRHIEDAYCENRVGYNGGRCWNIHATSGKATALDMEFKVLRDGRIVMKQVREFHGR